MNEEELREKILNELKEEYNLIPRAGKQFLVGDIFKKYEQRLCEKANVENTYSNRQSIENAIRKIMSIRFGVLKIKDIKVVDRDNFRNELEKFILEIINW